MSIKFLFFSLFLSLFCLTGCYSNKEVNHLGLILGMTFDKTEDEQYLINLELPNFEDASGKEGAFSSQIIELEGATISDALSKLGETIGMNPFLGHTNIFVINQNFGKKEIEELIQYLLLNFEIDLGPRIIVARTNMAKDIFKADHTFYSFVCYDIHETLQTNINNSSALDIKFYEILNKHHTNDSSILLPSVELVHKEDGTKAIAISGLGVYDDGRFKGYLTNEEAMYYLLLKNKLGEAVLSLNTTDKKDSKKTASINVKKSVTKTKVTFDDQTLRIHYNINMYIDLTEQLVYQDVSSFEEKRAFESKVENAIQSGALNLISKAQAQYRADFLDFHDEVKRNLPKVWKQVERNFKSEWFSKLNVKINCKVNLISSGQNQIHLYKEEP